MSNSLFKLTFSSSNGELVVGEYVSLTDALRHLPDYVLREYSKTEEAHRWAYTDGQVTYEIQEIDS